MQLHSLLRTALLAPQSFPQVRQQLAVSVTKVDRHLTNLELAFNWDCGNPQQ